MLMNASEMNGNLNNYFRWNLEVFPFQKGKRILDLGCGPGMYFPFIREYEPAAYWACDINEENLQRFKELCKDHEEFKISLFDLQKEIPKDIFGNQQFDYVLLFDVLEHLQNEALALRNIKEILEKTGRGQLFLRVPAIQAISGENDKAIGHFRRYLKKTLKKVLEDNSFRVESIRYQNVLGIIPWFIIERFKKRMLAVSSSESRTFDQVVPFIKRIENIITPPIGLTINCICTIK